MFLVHQLVSYVSELTGWQRLGEYVSYLVLSGFMKNHYGVGFDAISNEVIVYCNIFGSSVEHQIVSQSDCRVVITVL